MVSDESHKTPKSNRSGRRMKALRKLLGMKQRSLADLLAIHNSHIGQIEAGHRVMSNDLMVALYILTGVDREWLSGEKGEDEIPLSIIGQPLALGAVKERSDLDQPRDLPNESQKQSINTELIEWALLFQAAVKGGKLPIAFIRSFRARNDFLQNASLEALHRNDGFILECQRHPNVRENARTAEYEERRLKLRNELQFVLSPQLLVETSHALNEKRSVSRYVGMLQKAIDSIMELEVLRIRLGPTGSRTVRVQGPGKSFKPVSPRQPLPGPVPASLARSPKNVALPPASPVRGSAGKASSGPRVQAARKSPRRS